MRDKCPFCGTLTGLHGFSFDKDGRYTESKNPEPKKEMTIEEALEILKYSW